MSKKERIKEVLDDLRDVVLIEAFNEYCRENAYGEDEFIPMDMFDECFCGMKPSDIISMANRDFSINDDYWVDGVYGITSYSTYDCAGEIRKNWLDELADYIVDNGDWLYVDEIKDVLNEDEDEEEDSED